MASDAHQPGGTTGAPAIPGIDLLEPIGRGAHSVVFKATRAGRILAVKIQKSGVPDPSGDAALRFRREGAILACLRHPGLPAILELGEAEGRQYIVREYVRGQTLSKRIEHGPMSESEILTHARRLTGALAEVHQVGMVHCDVKPDNILVDEEDGARLIDFGFAVRATSEHQRKQIAGTLLYAAPEQTGMLKRPLDGRSDLYALGVVLFECATGGPPFQAADAIELIRLHAVAAPPDIRERNPAISIGLAAVIHKLLAKDPDDRYQSREGLLTDLDRIEELGSRLGASAETVLGAADGPIDAAHQAPLLGRQPELDRFDRVFDRALLGKGGLMLVESDAGMGKSRLAVELVRRVRRTQHLTLLGRCPHGGLTPFAPLREALEAMLRRRYDRPEAERRVIEEQIRTAVGDAAPLLKRFSSALAALLGEVEELPGLEELQDQFYDALASFFLRLAGEVQGALLVIEDLEHLDDASRQVLARLAARLAEAPLLVVTTCRSGAPQVEAIAAEMGSALSRRLVLAPLQDQVIQRLIAGQLGDAEAELGFASRIADRCHGSPFAATEYVRSMLDAGLLRPSWGGWIADEAGLAQMDLPTDVMHLVLRRLDGLGDRSREILRAAALMGSRFELDALSGVFEDAEEDVQEAIADGQRARLLERHDAGRYAFVHAEVCGALLEDLSAERQRGMHQRIAEVLHRSGSDDSVHLFAVARHAALGEVERDPAWVFDVNFIAGQRSLTEYAHEEAYQFLQVARRCAEQARLELPVAFEEALGEVCARTGRLAEAIHHLERTIAVTAEPLERARLRARLTQTQCANFYFEPARQEAEAGMKELGMSFFRWLPLRLLASLYYWIRGLIADHIGTRKLRPGPKRERYAVFAKLCEYAAMAAYFDSRPFQLLQAVLKARFVSTRLGPSPAFVAAYSQYAVVLAVGKQSRAARRCIDRAEKVARQIGDRLVLARCQLYKGFVWHLCGSSVEAETMAKQSLAEHGAWLDGLHYNDACGDLVFNLLLRGYYREAWTWIERQLPRLWFTVGEVRAKQGNPWAGSVLAGLGRTTEGLEYEANMRALCEEAPRSERYRWGEMLAYRVLFHLEQGDCGETVDQAIAEHRSLGLGPYLTAFHLRGFFVFQAYARMEQAMRVEAAERLPHVNRLRGALWQLKAAAMIPSMRAHALVIEAGLRRLQGRSHQAQTLLERAERFARDIDSPWVLYEVARQRGHLLHSMGKRVASMREARVALGLALEYGWVHRARKLRTEFGIGDSSRRSPSSSASISHASSPTQTTIRDTGAAGSLRLQRQLDALLQVSLAASSVLDPDQQARNALDEIVRILGAQRAFLFRCPEDGESFEFQAGRDAEGYELDRPTAFSSTVVDTVRARREPIVVAGPEDGALLGSESIVRHDLRSILAAPLLVRDRIIGVIYLDNNLARGVFTEEDVEILLAIGNHIAISLETARAAQLEIRVEAEAEKRRLAESLSQMSHALSSTLNLEEVLDRLLDGVTGVLPHDRASVLILDEGALHRVRVRGHAERKTEGPSIPLGDDPLLAEVVTSRRPVVVRDTRRDARVTGHGEPLLDCWMGVPLISKDRVAGVLVLEHQEAGAYTPSEAEVANTFAGQAGIAIENARLFAEVRRLATTDELTGTFNRRHFFTLAEREFSRANRYGGPLSAIMLDVDHFKNVNDTHGHGVGDEVLRIVARRCQGCIRDLDVLGRYGGEEFVVVLPGTVLEQARDHLAERLRRAVGDEPIPTAQGPLTVTVSLGVAQASSKTKDLAALLDLADGALYRAKEGGRNRVEAAEDPE